MSKSRAFLPNLIKLFTTSSSRDQNEGELERIAAREPKEFSFKTLVAATRNFDSSLKLGEGGFGPVYKGKLDDGREVAIKKLSQTSAQGKKEFQIEVKLLARVQHKNVVTLLGYFVQSTEMLLVYEYVANESLDKLLFKSGRREILDWKRRYNVITGVAKGLLYLHQEAPSRIIHRDIKASNILLDDKWVPKIADFGMARLYSEDKTHVNTRVAGTNGYTAPEYLMHGHLSEKSDVFSFGVVLLELISGQKNSKFKQDLDPRNLLEWAYQLYKKQRSLEMMDNTLVSSADLDQVSMCIHIGLLCVQSDPKSRPDMGRVVLMLSKWPAVLEEPMRPGYPGSMYRMSDKLVPSSSATLSSSQSSATLSSSQLSFGSSTNSSATSSSHPRN